MDVLDVIVSGILSLGLTYTVVACDRLRLSAPQRARAWNSATTGSAILAFAPLCIIAWFWVTRRSLRGLALGFMWVVAILVLQVAIFSVYQNLGIAGLLAFAILSTWFPQFFALAAMLALSGFAALQS